EKEFISEMQLLNIRKPSYLVRATDHIKEQISLIQTLEKKGYTYKISDGIYYDTSKFKKYANFAKLDLDEQQAGARIEFNPEKRNKTDFALWKFSPVDQKRDMQWDSPWGIGFPGWHIECSAMALNYLGETIDIHAGGIDHIPVHHTNEIAQSEAATGKRLANYWMHSNHISVDGQKISKSLGNSITLKDIEKNNYSPEDLRLLVLESSYMTQSKFSYDALSSAKKRLEDLYAVSVLRYQANKNFKRQKVYLRKFDKDLLLAMSNNLDSPKVMVLLSEFTKKFLDNGINIKDLKEFNKTIKNMDELLGLKNVDLKDISIENKKLIEERVVAKQNNDYKKSDEIRNELLKRRIGLRDKETSNWYYL
ncbi:MAG: cysteine--tRNA ligase, partial [Chitinophagia bacterium]|nr:cysteine--tRNA ligase [Chitinophagia bacterium]